MEIAGLRRELSRLRSSAAERGLRSTFEQESVVEECRGAALLLYRVTRVLNTQQLQNIPPEKLELLREAILLGQIANGEWLRLRDEGYSDAEIRVLERAEHWLHIYHDCSFEHGAIPLSACLLDSPSQLAFFLGNKEENSRNEEAAAAYLRLKISVREMQMLGMLRRERSELRRAQLIRDEILKLVFGLAKECHIGSSNSKLPPKIPSMPPPRVSGVYARNAETSSCLLAAKAVNHR